MKMLVRRDGFVVQGQRSVWASPVSPVVVLQAQAGVVALQVASAGEIAVR